MSIPPEEERFYTNLMSLSDYVINYLNLLNSKKLTNINTNSLSLGKGFIKNMDKKVIIEKFINNSHEKCWIYIYEKKERFFIENIGEIFKSITDENISIFKDLFELKDNQGMDILSKDFKEKVWNYLNSLVKICIKFVYKNKDRFNIDYKLYSELYQIKL